MNQLRLKTSITSEFIEQVETELVPVIHECLMAYRGRYIYSRYYAFSFALLKPLSLFGMALSLLLLLMCPFIGLVIPSAFFFLFLLVFFRARKGSKQKLMEFYRPYWAWLAKRRANAMVRVAKKTAPFDAEYDFRGDLVVYYRTKSESSTLVWMRRIKGYYLAGNGFTLFFKKERAIYPYAIILNDGAQEIETYLNELGMQPFPRGRPTSIP